MRTPLRSALLCALVGFTTVLAPVASANAAPCTNTDGTATTGATRGSNPVKYYYGNSPYVGARYNNCLDVIKIYYGGYSKADYYNIREVNGYQSEHAAGANMVWTASYQEDPGRHDVTYIVQACNRGGVFQPSTCTRWSPTVRLVFTN
jgi:hypothetical protein